jgi:hypothetical protein
MCDEEKFVRQQIEDCIRGWQKLDEQERSFLDRLLWPADGGAQLNSRDVETLQAIWERIKS